MVWTCGMIPRYDPLQRLGGVAMGLVVLVLVFGLMALYVVYNALEWLQERRALGLIVLWAAICAGLFYSSGCATAPNPINTPAEPAIFRPVNPQYPLPR